MNFNLQQYLKDNQARINNYLNLILAQYDQDRELIAAMRHSLMAGGKRLRPILSIAAAAACKKDVSMALPVGCAIEMIHTYSLIHDDLPAMDDDDLRRGLPTCHKQFSEATAILAGDALLTQAFYIIVKPEPIFSKFPDQSIRLELSGIVSDAAGVQGMVEGQMLDMQACNSEADALSHLKKIHKLKTGKMIIASVQSGGVSVGAEPDIINKLTIYADKIGLAFQVVDDILNIEGDPDIMGKAAGSDDLNYKMTFPAIIGLDNSKKFAKELVEHASDCISIFDESADPLRAIAAYIINRDR